MQKGVRFRAHPNKEQQILINKTFGCCRLIYNKCLGMRNDAYDKGEKIGYTQTSAALTALKKEDDFAFLNEVDSVALQQSLRDLNDCVSLTEVTIPDSVTSIGNYAFNGCSSLTSINDNLNQLKRRKYYGSYLRRYC